MNKKEEVISSARSLFSSYGYKRVTMDEIAKKSGVTKKTIYNYFKDKDDLIKYFLYEQIDKMKKIVDDIENKNISAPEKTHQIIYRLITYKKEEKILKKMAEESEDIPRGITSECLEILNTSIISEIKRILESGIKKGEVKKCDTDLASFLIYKMYLALMFEWDKPIDEDIVTKNMMNLLKTGIFN